MDVVRHAEACPKRLLKLSGVHSVVQLRLVFVGAKLSDVYTATTKHVENTKPGVKDNFVKNIG